MTRRLWSACAAAALAAALAGTARAEQPVPRVEEANTGALIFGVGFSSTSGLTGSITLVPRPNRPKLRPTARRTLAGSLLFAVHPALTLIPMGKLLDSPCDHPRPADDVLQDMPVRVEAMGWFGGPGWVGDWTQWIVKHLATRHDIDPERQDGRMSEDDSHHFVAGLTELYVSSTTTEELPMPRVDKRRKKHKVKSERLPMPTEEGADGGFTCPYLRQQRTDRHACQLTDVEVGRDVLENLTRLEVADELEKLAWENAGHNQVEKAKMYIALARQLCPGRPVAERDARLKAAIDSGAREPIAEESEHGRLQQSVYSVADLLLRPELNTQTCILASPGKSPEDRLMELITHTIAPRSWADAGGPGTIDYQPLTKSLVVNQTAEVQEQVTDLLNALRRCYDAEEHRKQKEAASACGEPGTAEEVDGLMKACRLLVNDGQHEHAAELARQAYALDPQRVLADPLVYKMHLLAGHLTPHGSSEASELPSCPYCPAAGKPVHEVLPRPHEETDGPQTLLVPPLPAVDYEVVSALDQVLTEAEPKKHPAGAEESSETERRNETLVLGPVLLDLVGSQAGFDADHLLAGTGLDRTQFRVGLGLGGLVVQGQCRCGGTFYHLRAGGGCLALWRTPDASQTKP